MKLYTIPFIALLIAAPAFSQIDEQTMELDKIIGAPVCDHARSDAEKAICNGRVQSESNKTDCDLRRRQVSQEERGKLLGTPVILGRDLMVAGTLETQFYPTDPSQVNSGESAAPVCRITATLPDPSSYRLNSNFLEWRIVGGDHAECNQAIEAANHNPLVIKSSIRYFSRWLKNFCRIDSISIDKKSGKNS